MSIFQRYVTRCFGAVEEAEIRRLETNLGVALPSEYRAFLADHGSGILGHLEILGLGCEPVSVPSLPWMIGDLEEAGFKRPRELIPISAIGNGDFAAILAATVEDIAVGSVVYWSPRRDDELRLETAAASFSAWLEDQLGKRSHSG